MAVDLNNYVASIPDYPEKGIIFRDISPLMADGEAYRQATDRIVQFAKDKGVRFHGDTEAQKTFSKWGALCEPVTEPQLRNEWLSTDLNVIIVEDLAGAVAHIREYGSQHSDGILTESARLAQQFIAQVDSAAVYVNASTRFTDGGQFGLGAEVAVSTQKLHARGPMGLEALTTYKWVCVGDYSSRG